MARIFVFLCVILLAASAAFAQDLKFNKTSDLASGFESAYDGKSATITFLSDWSMRGWWLNGTDYSKYKKVLVEFQPVDFIVQLVVQYNTGGEPKLQIVQAQPGQKVIEAVLDDKYKGNIGQIYFQSSKPGKLKIMKTNVE